MKFVPDYYSDFKCIADKCRHSCCMGWEIDIDEESLVRYDHIEGSFGEKLRANICRDDDGAHFVLRGVEERCPFLQENGLCEMILNIGEENLCQICTDHPRFRNFLSDRTETGLGLCCEATAELIMHREEKMKLVCIDGEEQGKPVMVKMRKMLFDILQDREFSTAERMENLCDIMMLELPEKSFSEWCDFYLELEIMDAEWAELLDRARKSSDRGAALTDLCLEQLAVYFIFRHFIGNEDDGVIPERALFAVHAAEFINELHIRLPEYPETELARLYSAEIEYSEENLNAVLDELAVIMPN